MQKSPQPHLAAGPLSGQVAPTVVGPEKDRTELYLTLGIMALLGLGLSAYWISSPSSESEPNTVTTSKPERPFGSPTQSAQGEAKAAPTLLPIENVPQSIALSQPTRIKHLDVYFESGRKGLTDEAKRQLQISAELLKKDPNWGVLLQGYTDQQGSEEYNKKLGLRRAESVKEQLVGLGVPETSIKVVSLGKEGALCADTSDVCRRMNRRVHVEMRDVGIEHLLPPVLPSAQSTEQAELSDNARAVDSADRGVTTEIPTRTSVEAIQPEPVQQSDAGQ